MLKSLKQKSLIVLLISVGFLPLSASAQEEASLSIPALVQLVNEDRINNGLFPLRRSQDLDAAAALKALDMVEHGYFAHTSPEGINPWHWFDEMKYDYVYAGENLALDFSDAASVEKAWMASPKHRANILNNEFDEIGFAIADGTFNNINGVNKIRSGTIIVQLFGRRVPQIFSSSAGRSREPMLSPAYAPPDEQILGSNLANVIVSVNKISSFVLTKGLNSESQSYALGIESKDSGVPAATWPMVSLGLLALAATAGFHTKLIV